MKLDRLIRADNKLNQSFRPPTSQRSARPAIDAVHQLAGMLGNRGLGGLIQAKLEGETLDRKCCDPGSPTSACSSCSEATEENERVET